MSTEILIKNVTADGADDKKRSKGSESRTAILLTAARLATLRGLERLSIGDLAAEMGMSKSGLYAHFKSKEELELATIQTATEIFTHEVLEPGMAKKPGVTRLMALVDEYLSHLRRRVFPGGCFFASVSMELAGKPGPQRDRVTGVIGQWLGLIESCLREGQSMGEIDAGADLTQLVFEVDAMLIAANLFFVMTGDENKLVQARRGIETRVKKPVTRG